jgi:hypothetical protein
MAGWPAWSLDWLAAAGRVWLLAGRHRRPRLAGRWPAWSLGGLAAPSARLVVGIKKISDPKPLI